MKRSRYHVVLFTLSHFAALVALCMSSVWLVLKFAMAVVLVIHFHRYYLRFIACKHPSSICSIRLFENQWRVKLDAQWYRAWPVGEVVVTSVLICFKLSVEGKRHPSYLILFPDSADPVELHGFRLRLILESYVLFGGKGCSSQEPE